MTPFEDLIHIDIPAETFTSTEAEILSEKNVEFNCFVTSISSHNFSYILNHLMKN